MARPTKKFICRECGAVQAQWMGRCPDCGTWDGLEEHRFDPSAQRDAPRGSIAAYTSDHAPAMPINQITSPAQPRLSTQIAEFDRVLGGDGEKGVVRGSIVLLGGDPGIGKSTLLLQAAGCVAARGHRVLYVSSEESVQQIRLRSERLSISSENLFVLADTNVTRILEQVRQIDPIMVVLDSIQMVYRGDLEAAPGTVTQLRGSCSEFVNLAKATGVAIFLVGHVTKQGQLAGPRLLEHMVDTVLYFEGDRYHSHRIVRATKNRFGTALEVGLFEMTDGGLKQVVDSSDVLAAEYRPGSGSAICPVIHGSRCLLAEIQALTVTGILGAAKRKVSGIDSNRLAMLIAVLEKRGGLRLADQDVFVSAIGGIRVMEPAADLAIALAIAGAHSDRAVDRGACAYGELGLGGELRRVQQMAQRFTEAARMGFSRIICPPTLVKPPPSCELTQVTHVGEAVELLS